MKNETLKTLVNHLLKIEPNECPMISCFVNLEGSRAQQLRNLRARIEQVASRLGGQRRADVEDAWSEVLAYLDRSLPPGAKSAAVYSRRGDQPVFLPMAFEVPLQTQVMVDALPHVYPLIELKDTYHRFVIVITNEREARILETTIGEVTEEILEKRADLRERIGREWTREHYQNHKYERENQFIREKIRIIDDLMKRRGHNHLIVAGSPNMVGRMTAALPARLKDKLISTMVANPSAGLGAILMESVQLFVAAENMESHHRVGKLESAVLTNGLGVAGHDESRAAIEAGYADVLVIDQDDGDFERREELVRLAIANGIAVETVNRNDALRRLGGAGCLLRYRPGTLAKAKAAPEFVS